MVAGCPEISAITTVTLPRVRICEECVKTGDRWVHLRTCQTCGATLCCDASPNRHASRHGRAYVERLLARCGLEAEIVHADLRMEAGKPVAGLVVRATPCSS